MKIFDIDTGHLKIISLRTFNNVFYYWLKLAEILVQYLVVLFEILLTHAFFDRGIADFFPKNR